MGSYNFRLTTYLLALIFGVLLFGCETSTTKEVASPSTALESSDLINELNRGLTKVVSEDIFTPPVAARIYAYSNIAAHEAICWSDNSIASLIGQLNGYEKIEPDAALENMSYEMALIVGYCQVARHLVYREFLVDSLQNDMIEKYAKGGDEKSKLAGNVWGSRLAKHIIKWADADGYATTRNLPKYQPLDEEDKWVPTAPMYGEALEPHWHKLRPFFMDSSSQFRLQLPVQFSTKKDSDFYKATMEVYEMVKQSNEADLDVAKYWDCNPGPTMVDGHVMKVRKQNTPGGHWMGIHSIYAKEIKRTLLQTTQTSAILMAGISDAFIAAWDTKFHYHLLRPETYIARHIDSDWKPKLESPLFPEFASAHSAVSGVAASILTASYGELPFYDDTNIGFGLPAKKFDNTWQAAEEAAKSRLLGGIHYRFGCDAGLDQGKAIGSNLVDKFEIKK